jgi:hypothetical protein
VPDNRALAAKRIALLETFIENVHALRTAKTEAKANALRSAINRSLIVVQQAVQDAGIGTKVVISPPPLIGGVIATVDIFTSLFRTVHGVGVVEDAEQAAERAIGYYEHVRDDTGLVQTTSKEAIDILAALERALRPAFDKPPTDEKSVQAEVATILRAQGVAFHKEKERAAVGPTSFIPDFTVPDLDLAIEVKLSKPGHGEAEIQHELAEDVAAYGTKWKHIIVVIYDTGVIKDPEALKRENMTHFGITVLVVKH